MQLIEYSILVDIRGFVSNRLYKIVNTVTLSVPVAETVSIIWAEVGKTSFLSICLFEQFSDAAPIVECEKCENNYCYKDKILWSATHDCSDYGSAIGKLPENVKPCPTCGARVSRYLFTPHQVLIRNVVKPAQVSDGVSWNTFLPEHLRC